METSSTKIRVLLSAYACEPDKGSEPGVGWNVVKELAPFVDLTVVTRANNKEVIEASEESWTQDVRWIFWDPPKWLTFWKKGGRGVQLFYILWQWGVTNVVRKEIISSDFDIIHHLTFGKFWIPSRLAGLGKPFVFGPVGGGEITPPGLVPTLSARVRISDFAKSAAMFGVCHFPGVRRLYRTAAWTFAATPQTEAALTKLGVTRMSVLPQSGIRESDLPQIERRSATDLDSTLHLVTAARLIPWKAVDLAIEAVAKANKSIDIRLVVLQSGPEMKRLKALAIRLRIADKVEFKGKLPSLDHVYREIASSDALIHPALHEAFGQACLESLALGVPVICLDWAGPGMIVTPDTGEVVEPGTRAETVSRLADSMLRLRNRTIQSKIEPEACKNRAFVEFNWSNLAQTILSKYQQITLTERHRNLHLLDTPNTISRK